MFRHPAARIKHGIRRRPVDVWGRVGVGARGIRHHQLVLVFRSWNLSYIHFPLSSALACVDVRSVARSFISGCLLRVRPLQILSEGSERSLGGKSRRKSRAFTVWPFSFSFLALRRSHYLHVCHSLMKTHLGSDYILHCQIWFHRAGVRQTMRKCSQSCTCVSSKNHTSC